MANKAIILAGGTGSRLYPLTRIIGKQLLPVYDKPMIYYPLSTLLLAEISEIAIITTPEEQKYFVNLLGDGSALGISIRYLVQAKPEGIAQAFIIAEDFIGGDNVALILGDNIFYGQGLSGLLESAKKRKTGATVFGYYVDDPKRYGVADFSADGKVTQIIEKPINPPSNYAVTGLYFYDNLVVEISKNLVPSARGELEITDINQEYLKTSELYLEKLGRGFAWLDTGTHDSLLDAGNFIATIEKRQGLKICCPEEIAHMKGFIDSQQLALLAENHRGSAYGDYLMQIVKEA